MSTLQQWAGILFGRIYVVILSFYNFIILQVTPNEKSTICHSCALEVGVTPFKMLLGLMKPHYLALETKIVLTDCPRMNIILNTSDLT